ncbi:hypothetical protein BCL57_001231 [Agromyces flavus]|uniref:Uncharacterized protein n=1 Tax=Agromyces flavus TaxID=589382 RepID=A0A1H1ZG70_9MICO|nr:hypothetical protein [Agromyces flavus]MCP2367077.1 hypothetical protein [Agromyces flavus]GGI46446.1 hypothetical protein GCM10010932_14660 [Agromyces flavus]SDT32633.1 hypothetical protein SAMN04489721_3156 [Agromyces flavus]
MGELSEARRDLLESVAEEFLHNSWAGRRLVAVEATTEEDAARFADDLAAVLVARGQPAVRRSVGDVDEATLRRDTIEPFRDGTLAGAQDDETILVVDGRRLLNRSVRGIWHFAIWTLRDDELPHGTADVNVDVSDESAPTRYFYDLCKLPPSVGERRADPSMPVVESRA